MILLAFAQSLPVSIFAQNDVKPAAEKKTEVDRVRLAPRDALDGDAVPRLAVADFQNRPVRSRKLAMHAVDDGAARRRLVEQTHMRQNGCPGRL